MFVGDVTVVMTTSFIQSMSAASWKRKKSGYKIETFFILHLLFAFVRSCSGISEVSLNTGTRFNGGRPRHVSVAKGGRFLLFFSLCAAHFLSRFLTENTDASEVNTAELWTSPLIEKMHRLADVRGWR